MGLCEFRRAVVAVLGAVVIGGVGACPPDPNCVCGGMLAYELNCNIDGHTVKINYLPKTYLSIECDKTNAVDYNKLPHLSANKSGTLKSVSFKQCPLPNTSFKDVLSKIGVSKTMSLIYQNSRNLSTSLEKKLFSGLQDLSKLSLSINGITYLPDDLFVDVYNLTWLNIRSNTIGFSEKLFKPLDKLETLEISHNHMMNISGNIFSHLALLRKLSLWQSNVTNFSEDLFAGTNVLEELDLSSNGLNELPSSLLNPLRKLKKLTLFSNKFSSLPSNLLGNNQELDTIFIFNNDVKLMQLPKAFLGNLAKLKWSYIQRCGLETIPYDVFVNSSHITNISLAYNELETLPEAVFNDQINLLDLDLSNNKIKSLPSKLFSSLVKLERLNLAYNDLNEVSSTTFSSLLSLSYLDMEHNQLKTISSYLFSNNKQRIWINMAYNQLNFESKYSNNSSHYQKNHLSPFAYTYQLKLLNLSHNAIDMTFSDWWYNIYENLDLSFNKISHLSGLLQVSSHNYDKKLQHLKFRKQIWISHNPINCDCKNLEFLDKIQKQRITVIDSGKISCPNIMKITCDTTLSSVIGITFLSAIVFMVVVTTIIINSLFKHRSKLYFFIKKWCYKYTDKVSVDFCLWDINVTFAEKDEEFVEEHLISKLKSYKYLNIKTQTINKDIVNLDTANASDVIFNTCVGSVKEPKTVVIVTLNYLELIKNDCNLKKIHDYHLRNDNSLFILTSEINSVNTIDNDYMDMKKTLKWNEPQFWTKLLYYLPSPFLKQLDVIDTHEQKFLYDKSKNLLLQNNVDSPLDCPECLKEFLVENGPKQNLV